MKAAELIKTMHGTERLIVRDRFGEELFRGFKRLLDFQPETPWLNREIYNTKLYTEIYRREYEGRYNHKWTLEPVSREDTGIIQYKDIEEHIFIMIEVMTA